MPLAQFIPEVCSGARLILDYPSRLLDPLADGRIDAALIPVVGLFGHPDLELVDGTGICAQRQVRSVLLKCRQPLDEVRTVSLDPASRTSNALALILFRDHWKRHVEAVPWNVSPPADAAVVIGDRALCAPPEAGGDYDLATHWNAMTGLPFVFAVWAVRRNHPARREIEQTIDAAKRAGRAALPDIIRQQAVKLHLAEAVCREYFTECIHFDLGPREHQAMDRFQALIDKVSAVKLPRRRTPP
jgi:chorismate dehydratase